MQRAQEFFRGCLIGGAIGDALGWPVEFNKHDQIVHRYGSNGIQDLQLVSSGKAEITDDTQMTLFTAEGILRAETRGIRRGICHPPSVVFFAYQRWLLTQGYPRIDEYEWIYDGWLLGVKELHARRAPGKSCLSALSSRKHGTIEEPINNSKGCGGVMRVAPIGLFCPKERAFDMAADCAALTHGHPSGYLSAGALASIIASIIEGADIQTAVKQTIMELKTKEHHEECTRILEKALDLVKSDLPDYEAITQLGEGWVGEEALAVSVYCALKYESDFKKAIVAAVNHNGDSDSTGAITGNILGAYLGLNKIPVDWVEKVELNDIIIQVADDLLTGHQRTEEWWNRYPGY
ncbi:ADP-ribosylglycohydrolase family protein [Neobacillus bataviensis]|uniref:ADP-ribosylglycohydrolase family protein n=1 Tax=Neobacillus bataviensis TaxID=220685 RepID=UPI001CBB23E1|nr:ADP-ribosylglycohydrolase family protein [Neobacillus bataviensis]